MNPAQLIVLLFCVLVFAWALDARADVLVLGALALALLITAAGLGVFA